MFKYEEYLPVRPNELHWNRYIKFIEMCRKTAPKKKVKGDGYEEHHIIMKRYLPKELWRDPNNLIVLTPRQHFIAHMIFAYAIDDMPSWTAFNKMVHSKGQNGDVLRLTSKQYETLKRKHSESRKGYHPPKEVGEKIAASNRGKKRTPEQCKRIGDSHKGIPSARKGTKISEETRNRMSISQKNRSPEVNKKISESRKGRMVSEETRKRISKTLTGVPLSSERRKHISEGVKRRYQEHPEERLKLSERMKGFVPKSKGKICINNGVNNKYILESEKDLWLKDGWSLGMLGSGKTEAGFKIIYKDGIIKHVYSEELDKYLSQGWKFGNPRHSTKGIQNYLANGGNSGKKCVNNGIKNKLVPQEQLDSYLSQGWTLGRKPKGIPSVEDFLS